MSGIEKYHKIICICTTDISDNFITSTSLAPQEKIKETFQDLTREYNIKLSKPGIKYYPMTNWSKL